MPSRLLTYEPLKRRAELQSHTQVAQRSFARWGRIAAIIVVTACASLAVVYTGFRSRTATAPPVLARITDQVGARWVSAAPESVSFTGGEHLQLAEGFIELTFESGARVVVQSPADLTIDGKAALGFTSGSLTARVHGGGFVVKTPTAVVNDLGTEFGIRIGADRATRVEVFDGKVEASPSSVSDGAPRQLLTVGQAAEVAGEKIHMDPQGSRPEAFVRTLDAVIVRGSLVADLRPDVAAGSVVWSNHATGSDSVGDFAVPDGRPLSVEAAPLPGGQLHGAWFGQGRTGFVRSVKAVPASIAGAGNISVEAWLKVAGDAQDFRTVAYWGKPDVGAQRAFMVGQNSPFMGFYADVNGWGKQEPSVNFWQHVVWTYDHSRKEMAVYLNGRQVTSANVTLAAAASPIVLGAKVVGAQSTAAGDSLNGCLAALRVHTGVLEPEDVRHNFVAGMGNGNRIAFEK
jgi:hypothetical protein